MAEAERRTGRWAAVGYQWSFSRAVQDLKTDIMSGRFGRPLRLRCLYPWPRDLAYYGRNDWAGRKRDGSGGWVLDSPANNAMAHDLHNMFYLLGPGPAESARPAFVQAELYRAYPIENFDTAAARITTEFGTEVLFYVSHVSASDPGPVFEFEFESGTVHGRGRGVSLRGRFADGTETDYGSPDAEPLRKLDLALAEARTDRPPVCGIAAATSQTLCLNGMQDSSPDIAPFPADVVERRGVGPAERLVVTGLDEALTACYEGRRLPSEIGLAWARPGSRIDLRDYRSFPSQDPGLGLDGHPGKDG
jgi:predicted dehydrogenase